MKTFYSKNYQDKVNQDNVETLLKKAVDTWSVRAPLLDGLYAKELGDLFRHKKKKIMDTAYQWLFGNHNSPYFPAPAKWKEAIKYAEMMTSPSNDYGDWLEKIQVEDRFITKLDKRVLDLVKDFEQSELIDKFKTMNCWDKIREDYTCTLDSLTGYVVEILKKQFVILNKIAVDLPHTMTDQAYCNSPEFREKTLNKGFVSLDLLREQDIDQLLKKEQKRNEILKNSEFFNNYSIENIVKGLTKNLKEVYN